MSLPGAAIIKTDNTKVGKDVENLEPHTPGGTWNGLANLEIIWQLPGKLNISLPYIQHSNSTLRYRPKRKENRSKQRCVCKYAQQARLTVTAKEPKQPKCPSSEERINKTWSIYTADCRSATTRNEILTRYNMNEPQKHSAK